MIRLLKRLRERKLVQWALAYLAGAWLLLQVLHLLAGTYGWPPFVMRSIPVVLAAGLLATIVIAWYHGERGHQRVTGIELLVLAAIFVAATGAVGWIRHAVPRTEAPAADEAPDPRSIAVLPFENASGDAEQDYFADGIAEEILDALAQVSGLRVAARTSSFSFRGGGLPIRNIARELRVATVLEGSVRRAGDQLRITARLVSAAERQLWSQTFDRSVDDVFAVQREIAGTVARALEARLAPDADPDRAVMPSTAAHDLFLQGLFHWNRRTAQTLRRAIDLFEEAIRLDPDYARAHAGLALAWAVIHLNAPEIRASEALARAEAEARLALELDPELADAYTALGYAYHWQSRWDDAVRAFDRAVALNPNSSRARQWYAETLALTGRAAEAEAQIRQAVALDPLSLVAHGNLGLILFMNGRVQEAIAQVEATTRMDPGFAFPFLLLHRIYLHTGRYEEAREAGRRWAEVSAFVAASDVVTIVDAMIDPARRPAADSVLARWKRAASPAWFDIAMYYVHLGDPEQAMDTLEQAVAEPVGLILTLHRSPFWDPLRGSPRFQRILQQLGPPT
jgi:TolB-like protein/Tfp pilus assembly protein PilF